MGLSLLLSPEAVTAGASGMVYGCLGGVIVFGLKYRSILPSNYRRILGEASIPIVLLLFLMGFVSQGVDNAAHVGGLAAGLLVAPFLRPRLLHEGLPRWWGPTARAVPSLLLMAGILFGRPLLSDLLPPMRMEKDDTWGISVPVPEGWRPGANRFGQLAFFNGLSGVGRATFAAGAVNGDEPADAAVQARRFIDEQLVPEALGPEVLQVSHEEPVPSRIGDRDALLVRAKAEEPFVRTVLWAWFVPRGNVVYQLVFSYPEAYPRYAQVVDKMASGIRFEEPRELREARAAALLFPYAAWGMGGLGSVLQRVGEPYAAAGLLESAIRMEPGALPWRIELALSLLQSGELEAGCRAAEDAALYGPADPGALEVAARCQVALGNPEAALQRIREARKVAPSDPRLSSAERALRAAVARPGE
jgi:tetratricopeptide (TPR) repeat protein